jgi:hypothetical protein
MAVLKSAFGVQNGVSADFLGGAETCLMFIRCLQKIKPVRCHDTGFVLFDSESGNPYSGAGGEQAADG